MATKGITLFMYFLSSGMAPSSAAITLLSGRLPLLLYRATGRREDKSAPDEQLTATLMGVRLQANSSWKKKTSYYMSIYSTRSVQQPALNNARATSQYDTA